MPCLSNDWHPCGPHSSVIEWSLCGSDCSFNCAALQRQHGELDWGGKQGEDFFIFFFFCIFLFVAGEQWRGTGVCQGEGSPYCFSHLRIKSQLYC